MKIRLRMLRMSRIPRAERRIMTGIEKFIDTDDYVYVCNKRAVD